MAKLYITEFTSLGSPGGIILQGAQTPGVDQTPVAIGGSSVQSAAFGTNAKMVRLHTDAICSIAFGADPTALTNASARMAANQTEYFGVIPGQKVAVITSS